MRFKKTNKTIAQRIKKSIIVVALNCSVVTGIIGIVCSGIICCQASKNYNNNLVPLKPLYKTQEDFQSITTDLKSMIAEAAMNNSAGIDYASEIKELQNDINNQLKKYEKLISSDKERLDYNTIMADLKKFNESISAIEESVNSGKPGEAYQTTVENNVLSTELKSKISDMFDTNSSEAAQRDQTSTTIFIISAAVIIAAAASFALISIKQSTRFAKDVSAPILKMVTVSESIANGELDVDLDINSNDETGLLAEALKKIVSSLNFMRTDVNMLIKAALEGQLDTRADISKHSGDYKKIINSINRMLDAIKKPLDVAFPFIKNMADGVKQDDISNIYKGDFAKLVDNLNEVNHSLAILVSESDKLAKAGLEGDLDVRGDESKLSGEFAQIIHGVNQTFDAIKEPLDVASDFIGQLAAGTSEKEIENVYRGYYARLINNLNSVHNSLHILLVESATLADAGAKGNLDVRGDVNKVSGHYMDIIKGMNGILDAVSAPLDEATAVLEKMAVNDFTVQMTGNYTGMYKDLAESIKKVCEHMRRVEDMLVDVSNGNLGYLEDLKKSGSSSENDKIIPCTILMTESINNLISEANRLATAAVAGDLSQRGDESKFNGSYRDVIIGFNKTIEAVVAPLTESSNVFARLAHGDLTVKMTGEYKGSFNNIKESINQVVDSFSRVLNELNIAANQVAVGSKQVSDASQSLSQGAAEQASSVEELTSSLTEVSAQTKQNAADASEASKLSSIAQSQAEEGNEKMREMLDSMKEINESSANISKIIKVIDDIAFQTNILALNAAVEAARAGQYGKGFAVVAEEVRNLAAKSAAAAKDTTALIESSISKVESGTTIANETADKLDKISKIVVKSASLIKNIASASNEQATAIAQIDQGLSQVSTVVQTNSATAEESAAASEELSGQSETLKQLVSEFKLTKQEKPQNVYADNKLSENISAKKKSSDTKANIDFGKY